MNKIQLDVVRSCNEPKVSNASTEKTFPDLTRVGAAYTLSSQIPPTPVRHASMCKLLKLLMSFLKFLFLQKKKGKKVMNQSISLKNSLVSFIFLV